MKLRHIFAISALLASSAAMATEYVWTGEGGNMLWENAGNWSVDGLTATSFPKATDGSATAVIGSGFGTITWSDHVGKVDAITLGAGTSLAMDGTKWSGDLWMKSLTLSGSSQVTLVVNSYFGIQHDMSIDLGTFTKGSSYDNGFINFKPTDAMWTNGHKLTLTGTLDLTDRAASETGSILLLSIKKGTDGDLSFDWDGMNVTGGDVTYSQQVVDGMVQVVANYTAAAAPVSSIPEPTTATLSLLALAGLAARRRRG